MCGQRAPLRGSPTGSPTPQRLLGRMRALDPEPLLRFLHGQEVRHILIGGVALGGNFRLETDLGALDLLQWIPGIDADDLYTELHRDALTFELDGVAIRY